MSELDPVHGGTDSLPDPRYDFSSNANSLGPCPWVLQAVRSADVARYPDPLFTRLRSKLAEYHHVTPDRIVIGAGASELILRLIRHFGGSVQQLAPTFSEYERCARIAGRALVSTRTATAFLRAQRAHPGVGFVCWPNNPTGMLWPTSFVAAAAAVGPLIVDLAYLPLCNEPALADIEEAAERAYRLYSPNKSLGLTGIRGAYVVTPRAGLDLARAAPSWIIGREAEAMLEAGIQGPAHAWLLRSRTQLHRWRGQLAESLRALGYPVRESPATFLLAKVGQARRITTELRGRGVRVRDGGSFGLRQWIRLSAQPPRARNALLAALRSAH